MLSTRLTTTDKGVLSHDFIPENVRSLIERRTADNKIFGKLEISAPRNETATATATATEPRNIIAGFLLDTSGSMRGTKIQHAVNTIKKFVEVLHSERNGKTIQHQPIHSWIYLITFNSRANLVIPFQEITDETLPIINEHLDHISTTGSTNYERGFQKQAEVLEEIIAKLESEAAAAAAAHSSADTESAEAPADTAHSSADTAHSSATTESAAHSSAAHSSAAAAESFPPQPHQSSEATAVGGRNPQRTPQHYHVIRFFETDGDITEGLKNIQKLYEMMRKTTTITDVTSVAAAGHLRLTFEDVIIGYGTDVELSCLKTLASPYAVTTAAPAGTTSYNCSSLITIIQPEDIGWQVGEILFKVIMRFGFKVQVDISTVIDEDATVELFEYQTHQWNSSTTLHSIIHGEKKSLYIQYTPSATAATAATAANPPPINVKIQYENQFTGSTYTYEFAHDIRHTPILVPDLPAVFPDPPASTVKNVTPLILGMIHIEILKQYREIEASRYDKDTIVREAYKMLRMLKSIDAITRLSFPALTCQTLNLMTDTKVIIGLTTIQNYKEQTLILHARRVCSAEQDLFNIGAAVSREYVEDEEDYEEEAILVIKAYQERSLIATATAEAGAKPEEAEADEGEGDGDGEGYVSDTLPSRIPTMMPQDYMDTPFPCGGAGASSSSTSCNANSMTGSEVRTLCIEIALARNKNEDISAEKLYEQMRGHHSYRHRHRHHHQDHQNDDMFSSTPMDDDYTQRRMGMMRQMSSQ